ncbi:hypothetical protein NOIMNB_NOIMNB_13505, partial [Dysosmobacter welbionis]
MDGDPRAGGVVPLNDLGHLVVVHGTAGKAAPGGLERGLQVDARLGREGIALRNGHQDGAADHVVHQLGDAAAGGAAGVNGTAHARQDRLYLVKGLFVAAGHNGQRPGDGHGVAAADRGVQQEHPRVLGLLVQLQNDVRCGGAQVHNHIAG